jgi:hypothetical protein
VVEMRSGDLKLTNLEAVIADCWTNAEEETVAHCLNKLDDADEADEDSTQENA